MTTNQFVKRMMDYGHYLAQGESDQVYLEFVEELVLALEEEHERLS